MKKFSVNTMYHFSLTDVLKILTSYKLCFLKKYGPFFLFIHLLAGENMIEERMHFMGPL